MSSENILIVDDDGAMLLSLSRALKSAGLSAAVHAASDPKTALELLKEKTPQVAVIDLSLDEREGVEGGFNLIREILSEDAGCRIIVLTGHGSIEHGVRALNSGAANFLEKPADTSHLLALIRDGIQQATLRREYQRTVLSQESVPLSALIGKSSRIAGLKSELQYAASNSQPLVLCGETGTGKGLCARIVHQMSARSKKRLVRYQTTFATADLVNSDLFGHRKGAFTGANEERQGLLAEADGGTFFLDEVDELLPETQIAMLSVLQEKKYRQIGADRESEIDIRLISATNQELEECVSSGKLRKDFYHRIAHLIIEIPPLRDRKEDISDLVSHIAGSRIKDVESVMSISSGAIDKLCSYDYPGNVRELESIVEGAVYRAQFKKRSIVGADDINLGGARAGSGLQGAEALNFHERVKDFKRRIIKEKLLQTGGNQVKAAAELGLDRSTMRRLLQEEG